MDIEQDKNIIDVYASWASELKTKYKRVSKLFRHGPSIGRAREIYLADIIRRVLPGYLDVAHGAFYDLDRGASKEQDILIIDKNDVPAIERVGDFGIYHKHSVKACIEVKTKLTKKELASALALLTETRKNGPGGASKYCLFAYESTMSAQKILDSIVNTEDFFDFRPSIIVVLGKFVIVVTELQPKKPNPSFVLTAFAPKKKNYDLTVLELLDTIMELDGFTPFKSQSKYISESFEQVASRKFTCPVERPGNGLGTNLEMSNHRT